MNVQRKQAGFALVTVLMLVAVLAALLIAYFTTTSIELTSTKTSADMTTGLYAAEGGLNLRGERIRLEFDNYGSPLGTPPAEGTTACVDGNDGSGDYACDTIQIQGRDVTSYVLRGLEKDR